MALRVLLMAWAGLVVTGCDGQADPEPTPAAANLGKADGEGPIIGVLYEQASDHLTIDTTPCAADRDKNFVRVVPPASVSQPFNWGWCFPFTYFSMVAVTPGLPSVPPGTFASGVRILEKEGWLLLDASPCEGDGYKHIVAFHDPYILEPLGANRSCSDGNSYPLVSVGQR
jgi:hypothetical protein